MFSPPSHPALAPNGEKLAFDDDKGILVAQGPGWQSRPVLPHGLCSAPARSPRGAPDGARLTVGLNLTWLYLVRADGTG